MAEEKEEIRVIDKRRFDNKGNPKEESTDQAQSDGRDPSEQTESKTQSEGEKQPQGEPVIDFSAFILSLTTQALAQLGEIQPPKGIDIKVDVKAAKQTIDILSMLEEKTKGNLDEKESAMLEKILHDLRISYVKAVK